MDDMSSINAFHLPLPAMIGTHENDLGQFIAFDAMKDGNDDSLDHFLRFGNVLLPDSAPKASTDRWDPRSSF
jgi:hypothetical protein